MNLRNQLQGTTTTKTRESAPEDMVSVTCPACAEEFSLNEAVLSSVREDLSRELQGTLRLREEELLGKQKTLQAQQAALKAMQAELDQTVQTLVDEQLKGKTAEIQARAVKKAADDQAAALGALREELDEKAAALKKAQQDELRLRKEKREIEEAKANLQLEVERKLEEERGTLRQKAKAEADEENRLKLAQKEKVISDLQEQLKDATRRAEQGSQQAQGEILELDFERQLRQAFPLDSINEVSKGVRGADVSQEVVSKTGRSCGTIVYENKRTKNWSDAWVAKLKDDMREARAEIGVIVTEVLPRGVVCFAERDGVWVTDFASAIPLAHVLRHSLLEVTLAKGHREGAKEKMELLYAYLTGTEFRQRVQAVIGAFKSMRGDLERERRALTKNWSKREKHINAVVENMAGMIGDVQALSGNAIQEIPALEMDDGELDDEGAEEDAAVDKH